MKKISILCLTLLSFLFSQSQIRYLKGVLQGSQATPPNNSTGSGVIIVKYDMSAKTLKLYGDYAGLTTAIADAHIHRGQPGFDGPIVTPLTFSGDTTGTLTGTGMLTQMQEDSLLAGNMYANVHTSTYPKGEIRAQLTPATNGASLLSGRLQSAQETPPNSSIGKGSVYALLDTGTDSLFITGSYTGLTGASTMAHIHTAPPESAALPYLPIYHSFATSGVVHLAEAIDAGHAVTIATGGSYVNVHTVKNPGGEIRAQLINNSTGRYFVGEFSGANEAQQNLSTKGRGVVVASYDPNTRLFQLAGDYQHLTDTITRANLVTPAVIPGDSIPLITTRDSIGTLTDFGSTLTAAQEADLLAGNAYVNVFSRAFPNGEIRANLTATAPGETQAFAIKLSPEQEVPVPSPLGTATGNALVLMDKTTGKTYVTGAFQGFNSAAIRAYIRGGAVGDTSGTVFLDLAPAYLPLKKSGTFSGSGIVPAQAIDSMISGLSYVNVLSIGRPLGAVRGQMGDLVLPLKLKYFNGYKQRNEIELVWETSEELNVSRYEIEQLNTTSNAWIKKGTVYANGGNSSAKYTYTDIPNTYGNKYIIYRLKMIDKDGKITYSYLVKVNFEKLKAELFIQTNPVTNGELRYSITGLSTNKKAEVSIIDFNGRLLLKNTVSSLMNNTLKISHLSAGMYKLVVRVDDTMLQQSFIK